MKKGTLLIASLFLCASILVSPAPAKAALTSAQVTAILNLLTSFGAPAATVANVQSILTTGHSLTTVTAPTSSGGFTFTRSLTLGATGADVTALQQLLVQQGYLSATPTGYYGTLTTAAVTALQKANTLEAVGSVGPLTRTLLNKLEGQPTTPSTSTTPTSSPSSNNPSSPSTTPSPTSAGTPTNIQNFTPSGGGGGGGSSGGGGGGGPPSSTPPPSTPPPTPAPTLTFSSNVPSVVSGSSATLTWSSANADSCSASGSWSGTESTTGTQTLTNLTIASTYTLTCSGAGGSTNQSVTITVTQPPPTPDTTRPTAPTNLSGTAASQTQINLTWTASTDNTGVTGYQVFRGATQVGTPTGLSYSDTGLTSGTQYTYTVKAVDAAGNVSAASAGKSITTLAPADTTPPTITITAPALNLAAGTTQTTLAATTNEAASCRYSTTSTFTFSTGTLFTTTGNLSHSTTLTGLQNSTSYTYYVKCTDSAGNIDPTSASVAFSVATPPDGQAPSVPTGLSATAISSSQINLSWTNSTDNVGVTGYKVYRNTTQVGTATTNSYSDTGLTASTAYSYTVSAYDAATNNSAQSTGASATTQAAGGGGVTAPYLDANGWTVFTPTTGTGSCSAGTYTGTCIVYISNSAGNDSTCAPVAPPVNQAGVTPCKTISKGMSLLRNGKPDWILLKKGDTWTDQAFGILSQYGRSASEPMLYSSYGTGARPLIKTNPALNEAAIEAFTTSSGGNAQASNYLALVGIEFYAYTRDPNSPNFNSATIANQHEGFHFLNASPWFLMEDCKFSFYDGGGDMQAGNVVSFRRNVITDSYSTAGHSAGAFLQGITNLTLQENFFDHNGWNTQVAGAGKTIFNHNIYIHDLSPAATVIGNISAEASSFGLQQRPGGVTTDNLLLANSIGMEYGSSESATFGPLTHSSTATNNVILENVDTQWGILVNPDTAPSIVIQNNIIAHEAPSNGNDFGIDLDTGSSNVNATNNIICAWQTPIENFGTNNVISPNITKATDCNGLGYVDPNRTIETYDASIGGPGTMADFLARARLQSKDNWNPALTADAVNNYIRAGFTKSGSDTTAPSVPTGLSSTAISSSQINLTWTASTDNVSVTGYKIYRGGTQVGTATTNSYSDTGLTASTAYSYTVSAYDAAGNNSTQSTSASATTQSVQVSGTPQVPTLFSTYTTRPSWQVAGVDYYVGPRSTPILNPSSISMAGVSLDTTNKVVTISGNNVTLTGYDFSLGGGWSMVVTGSNDIVQDSKFALGTSRDLPAFIDARAATGFAIQYCTVDATNISAFYDTHTIMVGTNGTIQNVYLLNSPNDGVQVDARYSSDHSGGKFYFKNNLVQEVGTKGSAHGDIIQWIGQSASVTNWNDIQITGNTAIQHVQVNPGNGFYLSPNDAVITSPLLSQNTIITYGTGPGVGASTNLNNVAMSYPFRVEDSDGTGSTVVFAGSGSVTNNYIDDRGAYDWRLPPTYPTFAPNVGYSGNIDLTTGQPFSGQSSGTTPPPTDTTPPIITISAPSGQLTSGTTQTSLTVTTNETAACAWSNTAGTAFASMSLFTSTGGTSHSTTLTGLSNGTSYTTYVKCKDTAGNISADSSTAYSVAQASSGGGASITIGETSILPNSDSDNANLLVAQNTTLAQAATIQSLSFYVTSTDGANLVLGIYDAAGPGGGPGALKAQTASFAPVVGWNTAPVVTPVSLPAGAYWLAYLPQSNSLGFTKNTVAGTGGKYYTFTFGAMPATFSTSPNTTASHWSFYGTLSVP